MVWHIFIAFALGILLVASGGAACSNGGPSTEKKKVNEYFTVEETPLPDGQVLQKGTIGGPPEPPHPEQLESVDPEGDAGTPGNGSETQ